MITVRMIRIAFSLGSSGLLVPSLTVRAQADDDDKGSYVVVCNQSQGVPASLRGELEAAGAEMIRQMDEVGAVVVESSDPDALEDIATVRGVVPAHRHTHGEPALDIAESVPLGFAPPNTGDDDPFFDRQYGHDAVGAPAAWAKGYFGQGITVAILDEGFQPDHPDLAPNVVGTYNAIPLQTEEELPPPEELEESENLFGAPDGCNPARDPECRDVFYTLNDPFSHGTHVAGTIGAADNGFGTIGVAPQANLLLVKVLSERLGFGLTEWIVDGIIWAADHGADIINMSLGGSIFRRDDPEEQDYIELYTRAVNYAISRGVLVFSSAGNSAFNFAENPEFTVMPAGAGGVVAVAATGAYGWALSPETGGLHPLGLDRPAYSYSNLGGLVDMAAPGGDSELYDAFQLGLNDALCQSLDRELPCGILDFIFSTGSTEVIDGEPFINWYWSVGTSMASPHAAAVAALIKSEQPQLNVAGLLGELQERLAAPVPDINYVSPLGYEANERLYFGGGRAASDYALPSDYLSCQDQAATIYVSPSGHIVSPDRQQNGRLFDGTLLGTEGDDVIVGTEADDVAEGGHGDDLICGGDGDDILRGGPGNDILIGGPGDNTLSDDD